VFGIPPGQKWDVPAVTYVHGTHVAGTIVAQGGNKKGVVGVIPSNQNICMRIARVFNDAGEGNTWSEINKAVEWCATTGARVINMSLGTNITDTAAKNLMTELVQKQNILVVAAAGNDGAPAFNYPASYPDVISVASVNEQLARSWFSNFNAQVDLSGPGENVLSTAPGNAYAYGQGTSMAAPHVTGAIAKIWAARPQCTNMQVRAAVEGTAKDLGPVGRDDLYGHGLVQAKAAYKVCC
jgi:serine protease